jgi:nitrate/TMAO reductase-like tetraheme cytochrome c subunit
VEQLQASLTAQAANQASLEEQLAEAQERLAMEDGNKARFAENLALACARCPDVHIALH